ncbi:lyase family protein [Microcella alkalica]|uniref:lyase family protein n=1 Tax=Microcella alkalica TaxID=355930 RepID=UPI00145E2CB2|nr:lyase family protein [Microcella alkalica]
MPTDPSVDRGLASPVSIGAADAVGDAVLLDALVAAEVALTRAWATVGVAPADAAERISVALGWRGAGHPAHGHGVGVDDVAEAAVGGGNPVIPLVSRLRGCVDEADRAWVHRGATSQDIVDSALMLLARRAGERTVVELGGVEAALATLARDHRDLVVAARTLGQHAVPTTMGMRAATWLVAVRRARRRLAAVLEQLPAQLGGAAGTLAALVEHARASDAADPARTALALVDAFAAELALAAPELPWHTTRWPVTELGDALVQAIDALGVLAGDVALLARTEVGEVAESAPGGSSAMPQKRNPVGAVLVRSAALRAPQLAATLHTASALAVDERPDGAWHAEWSTLRELLRLALGAASTARALADGLVVDPAAAARTLSLTGGLLVAERLGIVLAPLLGADRATALLGRAADAAELERLLRAEPAVAGLDLDALLDPAAYTGATSALVDRALEEDDR